MIKIQLIRRHLMPNRLLKIQPQIQSLFPKFYRGVSLKNPFYLAPLNLLKKPFFFFLPFLIFFFLLFFFFFISSIPALLFKSLACTGGTAAKKIKRESTHLIIFFIINSYCYVNKYINNPF